MNGYKWVQYQCCSLVHPFSHISVMWTAFLLLIGAGSACECVGSLWLSCFLSRAEVVVNCGPLQQARSHQNLRPCFAKCPLKFHVFVGEGGRRLDRLCLLRCRLVSGASWTSKLFFLFPKLWLLYSKSHTLAWNVVSRFSSIITFLYSVSLGSHSFSVFFFPLGLMQRVRLAVAVCVVGLLLSCYQC